MASGIQCTSGIHKRDDKNTRDMAKHRDTSYQLTMKDYALTRPLGTARAIQAILTRLETCLRPRWQRRRRVRTTRAQHLVVKVVVGGDGKWSRGGGGRLWLTA